MKEYLKRTHKIRKNESQLFISFQKPYHAVSKATISRWLLAVMREAGVDVEEFKAHSTRAACTSAAKRCKVDMDEILRSAGWKNNRTFAKFYDKVIHEDFQFEQKILQDASLH